MRHLVLVLAILAFLPACSPSEDDKPLPQENRKFMQQSSDLINGEVMAIAYSGFRAGQHPDRGEGANNPSREEILEDLQILVNSGFGLIRMYDTGENTVTTLELIAEHD
ncbi:MAG: hypothetical protein OEY37_11650, partial [Gammaproteobacteria bacterium]|nr:hypothetical protein [Gammaproteobacteria bacterium]